MNTYTIKELRMKLSNDKILWMRRSNYIEHLARNKYVIHYKNEMNLDNLDFSSLNEEYTYFLAHKQEIIREKYRAATKRLWQNSDYREKVSKAIKNGVNKESSKKLKSEKSTKYWSDIEKRKEHSLKIKAAMSTEESKALRKQISIDLWKNEEYRHKVISSVTQSLNTEEVRQKRSESMKKVIETTDIRSRISKTLKQTYEQNPSIRQKLSEKSKEAWSKPGQKLRASIKAKAMWSDPECRKRIMETRKAHYSKMSNAESGALSIIQNFTTNIIQQYYSDLYPYKCDFYIPELDLYIECHFNWTHGGAPYTSKELWCQEQLKHWQEKAKSSKYYKNAIYTWTDLDVRKRRCAEEHNLNWVAVYSNAQLESVLTRYYNNIGD